MESLANTTALAICIAVAIIAWIFRGFFSERYVYAEGYRRVFGTDTGVKRYDIPRRMCNAIYVAATIAAVLSTILNIIAFARRP